MALAQRLKRGDRADYHLTDRKAGGACKETARGVEMEVGICIGFESQTDGVKM